jgi:hypothetical protein
MSTTFQTVHIRVTDAATGRPTPVRLRITGPAGEYYAPFGRLVHFALGDNEDVGSNVLHLGEKYAYIDGDCEARLPAGALIVEVSKGPEYTPVLAEVYRPAGKIALRFTVERWTDLRAEGWYSGDTRLHFLSPHAALLEAAAEDVAVANLLARWCDTPSIVESEERASKDCYQEIPAISNLPAFSGQHPALERPGHMVVVNTHNVHGLMGSLGLLNCHRIVYPLSGEYYDGDEWLLADWCDQCHRKGGLVIMNDLLGPGNGGEALADLLLGKVDAIEAEWFEWRFEVSDWEDHRGPALDWWYKLLNCGSRVPLVGASGKVSNCEAAGALRTYARLAPRQDLTYGNWVEAVRAGRVFATTGPLLSLTVNGQDPGAVVALPSAEPLVHVRAEARSATPFDLLEVVANGAVIAQAEAEGSTAAAVIDFTWRAPASGWVAARCFRRPAPPSRQFSQIAHTSAVYLTVDGRPMPVVRKDLDSLLRCLDEELEAVAEDARLFEDAESFYAARAEILRRAKQVLIQRAGVI